MSDVEIGMRDWERERRFVREESKKAKRGGRDAYEGVDSCQALRIIDGVKEVAQ